MLQNTEGSSEGVTTHLEGLQCYRTHGGSSEGFAENMEGLRMVLQKQVEGLQRVLQTHGWSSEGVIEQMEGLLKLLHNTWRVF